MPYKKKQKTFTDDAPFAEAVNKMMALEERMLQERRVCELYLHTINLHLHTIKNQYQ